MNSIEHFEKSVGPNSCKIAHSQGKLVARNLFSDLLLVLYAAEVKVGVMLRAGERPDQLAFAEASLRLLFAELASLGIKSGQMSAHVIGGMPATSRIPAFLERLLSSTGIKLTGSDLGNDQNRSAWLSLDSGCLIVRATCLPAANRMADTYADRLAS